VKNNRLIFFLCEKNGSMAWTFVAVVDNTWNNWYTRPVPFSFY